MPESSCDLVQGIRVERKKFDSVSESSERRKWLVREKVVGSNSPIDQVEESRAIA